MAHAHVASSRHAGLLCVGALLIGGCGGQSDPAIPGSATSPGASAQPAPTQETAPPAPLAETDATWTPEALEELLAPIALYPDPVLAQVLTAATNPQEVLDAGNWLVANPELMGKALDEGAAAVGFTPPVRGLLQSPQVIDQMCLNLAWTEELGQAYVNDQAGVMDAVQRLRTQAKDVGNLESSDYLKVETEPAPEPQAPVVVKIESPTPEVVYVPQYDPVVVYAPPPAQPVATQPAPTTQSQQGHSTDELITTGLLAFGAGILVNEIFDDDDDYWHSSYYGGMWRGPMPYYPPVPYRPVYGGGFYPSHSYSRNNVVINNFNNANYWNRYNNQQNIANNRARAQSPITAARPNRPELQQLNAGAAQAPRRQAPPASDAWRGKRSYAGADPASRPAIENRANADPARREAVENRPGGGSAERASNAAQRPAPKVQGTYAGARPEARAGAESNRTARSAPTPASTTRPEARSEPRAPAASGSPAIDRGHDAAASRSAASTPRSATALSRDAAGGAQRAASERGRESAARGATQHARGGNQGGRRR